RVFAEHIRDDYGFEGDQDNEGRMLGFLLTKAGAMSPALKNTEILLNSLMENKIHQYTLFG
ncbi:MAG: DNA cytosine methyltransferase, partial [Moorea sp. SIO3I6]|nr:DNA cytosine methyltransferase [Moorena sp. SIO3I6]